jgi:hypothetical protein
MGVQSRSSRVVTISTALASFLLLTTALPAASTDDTDETEKKDPPKASNTTWGKGDDKTKDLTVGAAGDATRVHDANQGPQDRYFRADAARCAQGDERNPFEEVIWTTVVGGCPAGEFEWVVNPAPCEDGSVELDELWVERVQPDGDYLPAEYVSGRECVTPADVAAEAQRAFAAMHIPTPTADVQGGDVLLVNEFYPASTSATALTMQVDLLDVPVAIRADPVEFTWDFDDPYTDGGGTLTTTDPGRQWVQGDPDPDASWVAHRYLALGDPDHDPGTERDDEGDWYRDDVTTTLTTTWHGSFQLVGTSIWTPIDGAITTTTTLDPVRVTEARVRLVCSDLLGNRTC